MFIHMYTRLSVHRHVCTGKGTDMFVPTGTITDNLFTPVSFHVAMAVWWQYLGSLCSCGPTQARCLEGKPSKAILLFLGGCLFGAKGTAWELSL